jgi:hypothetical protein
VIIDQTSSTVQGLVEIPYILAQAIIYSTITYAMINFQWTAGISTPPKVVLVICLG